MKIIQTQTILQSRPIAIQANQVQSSGFSTGFEGWLPYAAPCYQISPDPKDYILYPVPILYSDLPNRNGYAMSLSELIRWQPEHGCQSYVTWKGKPMFSEHKSDDLRRALGVIVDVSLQPIKGFNRGVFWKVMALLALDRSKGAEYVEMVDSGEVNSYSIGAMVERWSCSYCNAGEGECRHIDPDKPVNFYELNGKLVYKNTHGIVGYETSIVKDPAYALAHSDIRLSYET